MKSGSTGEAAAVAEAPLFNGIPLTIGVVAICTFYVCVLIYEQVFGWYAGLDSFAPEFTTYWMTILYIEEPVELVSFLAILGYLWKTRDRDIASVQPREEMRRIFTLLSLIVVYGLFVAPKRVFRFHSSTSERGTAPRRLPLWQAPFQARQYWFALPLKSQSVAAGQHGRLEGQAGRTHSLHCQREHTFRGVGREERNAHPRSTRLWIAPAHGADYRPRAASRKL